MNYIFEYHRNKSREPIGCLIAYKVSDEEVRYGWSLCCKKDRFNREFGISTALGRSKKYDVDSLIEKIPESMIDHFCEFSRRAAKYYKRTDVPVLSREVIKEVKEEAEERKHGYWI